MGAAESAPKQQRRGGEEFMGIQVQYPEESDSKEGKKRRRQQRREKPMRRRAPKLAKLVMNGLAVRPSEGHFVAVVEKKRPTRETRSPKARKHKRRSHAID